MAFESTAINDFIAGLQTKPLQGQSAPNDWLFGTPERDDATEIDARQIHEEKATTPFDKATPPVVPLPQAFRRMPAPAIEAVMHRSLSPTKHVRITDWRSVAKKLALPIGVFSIAIVVMGVYAAKTDSAPARKPEHVAAAAMVPMKPTPAPIVAPKPASVEAKPVVETKEGVTPIETKAVVTPIDEALATRVPAAAPAAAPMPVAAPAAAPTTVATPPAAPAAAPAAAPTIPAPAKAAAQPAVAPTKSAPAAPAAAPAPVAPANPADATNIEPGSPASRFVASNEPTVPTVPTAKAKPAPAPTAVPGLVPPPKPTAAAAASAMPVVTKVEPKKRAPAKRAAKAPVAAKHTPAKKAVAAADDNEADAPAKPAAATGKGILQLSSTPAMEVWVDGRNSGAQTPVKIRLLAGKHKVTLFDKQNPKAKSFDVEIKPDATTKITKNYD